MYPIECDYYYMTQDEDGYLHLFFQPCTDWGDGDVIGDDRPLEVTISKSIDDLESLAAELDTDRIHGDPADCKMLPGQTLIGHRLIKRCKEG